MKKIPKRDWSLLAIKDKAITMFRNNSSVLDDCTLINIKRIYYLSLIAAPMRILDIYLFADTASAPTTWSRGIFLSHLVLLVFYFGAFLLTYRLKNIKQPNMIIHILQYIIPIIILASGVAIVTIDQLVTTNITPLLIVSTVFGAVFLIRPLASFLIYITSYLAYYYLMALTITNQQVLLSNRVNGATIIALGFLISVINWHYSYTNITQKRHIEIQQKQLKQLAYYDPLTNLYNRHFFNEIVEKELLSIQRYKHKSVIIILDIDNFKNINDTYGHLVGDQVLKQLARLIADNVRKSDTVSRFGGEEFIILAPRISLEEGFGLAEKLRKLVDEKTFVIDSTILHITASFGVSSLQATGDHGFEKYFSLADKALYLAKRRGKNRVEKISHKEIMAI
ncbi:MAG TPA: GGDEF domain-containing protein [Clostridia bacterium]|nr:GGDEF domain-containing protein [Clostridia bacterium]